MFWFLLITIWCTISVECNHPKVDSFLQNIFDKYGNKGYMSFEGLEHLMENLGLGHLRFEEHHNVSIHRTKDGGFQEVHDSLKLHEHNHTRSRRSYDEKEGRCLSPEELLLKYGLSPDHKVAISPTGFLHICPGIIYQLDTRVCSTEKTSIEPDMTKEEELLVWLYGVGSIVIMSACGLLGVLLVPLLQKALFQRVLSLLAALAVGTLSGDALLHLLPHALMGSNEDMIVLRASTTFITLLGFFSIEAIIHGRSK
uniref:Zinc transporter ZIP4/12 EF-hand domain-containing protein n=3 Tax=Rhodnius prolixus TaxID=13249 RepID=T1HNE0_RHOPR